MTIDNNAQTWRDLTDQLTEAQIRQFERDEDHWKTDYLLFEARECAQTNLEEGLMFGHLSSPAGAETVDHWQEHDGEWTRRFHGAETLVGGVFIKIAGTQRADGSTVRGVELTLSTDHCPMSGDAAAEFLAVFAALAEQL